MDSENKQKQSKNPSELTFTDAEAFARFVTETGKILPRRITGLSSKHQRDITRQIKRARNMLLMK
jgi:small subunit ribosomal protein S18